MRIFKEVLSDYTDPETHETAIDGYMETACDEGGIIVAWVKPDGSWRLGEHSRAVYLTCELVQEHIRDVVISNLSKQARETVVLPVPSSADEYVAFLRASLSRLSNEIHILAHLAEIAGRYSVSIEDITVENYPFNSSLGELDERVKLWKGSCVTKLNRLSPESTINS